MSMHGRITYKHGEVHSKDRHHTYEINVVDKDVEEYLANVATLGRQNQSDFYEERKHWERIIKAVKLHIAENSYAHVIIHLHDKCLQNTMYSRNLLQMLLQNLGVECYIQPCFTLAVHTNGKGGAKEWIQKCIDETIFVIEAQLVAMLPANVATPNHLAKLFRKLFESVTNAKFTVLSNEQLRKKGFGLITAVGKSAQSPPCMVCVERPGKGGKGGKGSKDGKTIALVGKGVTFDSGGLALKPNAQLMKMKYDKMGAVYGAYATYQMMHDPSLRHHTIVGVFPLAENALSAKSIHPGDVVKSYLGKTVEITDPDAEGRLLLADAFAYLHSRNPDVLLDIATLTGHAETIHCDHSGYFFASPLSWKNEIEKASYSLGERMIAMPSWTNGYDHILHSPVADIANYPSNKECTSSSFVATLFLKEFIPDHCDWLHIDLAHVTHDSIPVGHGIRTLIYAVHAWLRKN